MASTALRRAGDTLYLEGLVYVEECQRQARRDYQPERTWLHEITPGYGVHVHDDVCKGDIDKAAGKLWRCMRDCDDSDLIITIAYEVNRTVWQATYGVLNGKVTLWMD